MEQDIVLIQNKILEIRGQRVLLDRDLAAMYGVETKVLNQAVKRNIERFPNDFMFQLDNEEFVSLRSQFVTSNNERGGNRYRPFAFTEQGVAMLSSVLKSPTAIQINIAIVRAFVAMRQMVYQAQNNPVAHLEKEVQQLKEYIEEVFEDYNDINEDTRMQLELINEAIAELQVKDKALPPRRKIGFNTES